LHLILTTCITDNIVRNQMFTNYWIILVKRDTAVVW
jgi:hypothetical protein